MCSHEVTKIHCTSQACLEYAQMTMQSQLDSAQLHITINSLKSELATAISASSHLQICLSEEQERRHAEVQKCGAEHKRRVRAVSGC